jgi:hypothetical protein
VIHYVSFGGKRGKIIKASGEIKDQEEKDRGIHLFASSTLSKLVLVVHIS